jgi:hypothetical protein
MTTSPVEGRYDCPVCEDRFDSVGEKKRHIRTKHPKGKKA